MPKAVFENEHLFGGGGGGSNRCSWLLPKYPTIWFEIWDLKQLKRLKQFFTLCMFLAGKNLISQQQHSVNMLEKNKFITTLH